LKRAARRPSLHGSFRLGLTSEGGLWNQ